MPADAGRAAQVWGIAVGVLDAGNAIRPMGWMVAFARGASTVRRTVSFLPLPPQQWQRQRPYLRRARRGGLSDTRR
jgi:hypothetical protein